MPAYYIIANVHTLLLIVSFATFACNFFSHISAGTTRIQKTSFKKNTERILKNSFKKNTEDETYSFLYL